MAYRDYENRRYLGDDRDRWGARERDFDDGGYRGGEPTQRMERGPWQGGQGYVGSGSGRGYEDYGRNPREDSSRYYSRDSERDYNSGYGRDYNTGYNYNPGANFQGNPNPGYGRMQGLSGNDWNARPGYGQYSVPGTFGGGSERDLGYDRGQDRGFGTYVARDRNDGLHLRRDQDERGPFERLGDKFREGMRKLGKGPKAYTRPDERIREDIYDRLMHGWVNAEDVEVLVKNGEVTLTGFVEERRDKRVIEDLIEDVLGVKDVHNQLKVSRPETLGATATQGTTPTKVARS
ncbi:BON domain-containing protein [Pyxidicoccus parkwayensis]|uniref:BON domain-containing protein n=1 Tax=Pyxidicoccus parkwayensis TaxID=2813578 RepID=A0ABX7NWX7_9BACT|nr:BON domain-containing protein [Pyxidicoccus parkwaysis]QSQ23384.1 BON domain-containing protein [Pyxidicoccus parkwaysis]